MSSALKEEEEVPVYTSKGQSLEKSLNICYVFGATDAIMSLRFDF
jgi:hypothetical protein